MTWPCNCDCHHWFDPDGLLCIDGYCDQCGDLGGGDETMPRHPDVACACGSDIPSRDCCAPTPRKATTP